MNQAAVCISSTHAGCRRDRDRAPKECEVLVRRVAGCVTRIHVMKGEWNLRCRCVGHEGARGRGGCPACDVDAGRPRVLNIPAHAVGASCAPDGLCCHGPTRRGDDVRRNSRLHKAAKVLHFAARRASRVRRRDAVGPVRFATTCLWTSVPRRLQRDDWRGCGDEHR